MNEWWEALSGYERIMWGLAIPSSLVFIIQSILTFLGMDADSGLETDFDGDLGDAGDGDNGQPFQLFTFRNLVNFLLGFSWTGISLYEEIPNKFLLSLAALAVGALLVFLVMMIFLQLGKMVESGTLDYKNALQEIAEVYLTIPAKNQGRGKIHIRIQGALRELDAITREENAIPSGSTVRVTEVVNNKLLVVESI